MIQRRFEQTLTSRRRRGFLLNTCEGATLRVTMEKHPMNESIAVYENNTPANEERVPKNTQELIQEEFNFAPTGEESNALEVYAEDFQANQERVKR